MNYQYDIIIKNKIDYINNNTRTIKLCIMSIEYTRKEYISLAKLYEKGERFNDMVSLSINLLK